jgi:hypothetical protein
MRVIAHHFRLLSIPFAVLIALVAAETVFGQPPRREPNAGDQAAGCACCGSMLLMIVAPIVLTVFYFLINIAILFWVAKDAKSRGMDGAMWIFLILFTGVIGLAIYLFSRPQGLLTQCDNCGNNRMETSTKCPHCGIKTGVGESRGSRRSRRDDDDDSDDEKDDDDGRTSIRSSSRR